MNIEYYVLKDGIEKFLISVSSSSVPDKNEIVNYDDIRYYVFSRTYNIIKGTSINSPPMHDAKVILREIWYE